MTTARAQAYAHVMRMLRVLDPAKLGPDVVTDVRDAADTLVCCPGGSDPSAYTALIELMDVAERLQDSGSWTPRHVQRFIDSIVSCAPATAPV